MFWRQEALKQWSVSVTTSNIFVLLFCKLQIKQIFNSIWKLGLRFYSRELLDMLTSGPSCQCPPKLCTSQFWGFLQQLSALTQPQIGPWFLQKCSRQKNKTQHASSQHLSVILNIEHWHCKSLKYSRGYHRATGSTIILCSIVANTIHINT